MHHTYKTYPCPYCQNQLMYNQSLMYNPCAYYFNTPMQYSNFYGGFTNQYVPFTHGMEFNPQFNFMPLIKDYGPEPFVININEATKENDNYRTALWTGTHLQLTLMSINVGEDIGLEVHPHLDQFIRIEEGEGLVQMGDRENNLDFQRRVYDDFAIIIPAGKWHNLINTGNKPLKLYSIYAPPQHPFGTVHETKAIAQAAEENHP